MALISRESSAWFDLLMQQVSTHLALASIVYQISESHLLVLNPSVQQYCLTRDRVVANEVSRQVELTPCCTAINAYRFTPQGEGSDNDDGCAPVSLHISVDYAQDINNSLSQTQVSSYSYKRGQDYVKSLAVGLDPMPI